MNVLDADKAYKDSKLCNLLMGRHLAQLHPQLPVIAGAPAGNSPGRDGFFRNSRQANPMGRPYSACGTRSAATTEHPQRAAELLERLVVDPAMPLDSATGATRFWSWAPSLSAPKPRRKPPMRPRQAALADE